LFTIIAKLEGTRGMIRHITILLCFQLTGEVISRALHLPLPGPVLGMALFLVALLVVPRLAEAIRQTGQALLSHLSLLFVPAGVGVVGHLDKLGTDGLPLLVAILISTVLSIIVGVWTFLAITRLTGSGDV
jgi:holin-like protein